MASGIVSGSFAKGRVSIGFDEIAIFVDDASDIELIVLSEEIALRSGLGNIRHDQRFIDVLAVDVGFSQVTEVITGELSDNLLARVKVGVLRPFPRKVHSVRENRK